MRVHERVWERGGDRPSRRAALGPRPERPWRPVATWSLLGAMLATYVLQQVVGRADPVAAIRLFVIGIDWPVRPWSLVTSTFAHDFGDISHLLFNGLFLFFLGPNAERLLGRKAYVAMFLVTGALAGAAQVHLSHATGDPTPLALGASGALMAILGVLMVLTPRDKILVYGIVPVPMWLAGIGYAILDVLGLFNPYSGVGNWAHLAGLACGLAYAMRVRADWRRRGLRLVRSDD